MNNKLEDPIVWEYPLSSRTEVSQCYIENTKERYGYFMRKCNNCNFFTNGDFPIEEFICIQCKNGGHNEQ